MPVPEDLSTSTGGQQKNDRVLVEKGADNLLGCPWNDGIEKPASCDAVPKTPTNHYPADKPSSLSPDNFYDYVYTYSGM
ncbi:hypothetical protein UY3_08503 [Chelonia mydas]|uniref:Uncharacterized protein n=1 Tax=Chelonia mydas TaxID=8469 RepID=M7BB02_CHEMY|nr:hypothetical protein UY3_08503 [Chelonia mydas]